MHQTELIFVPATELRKDTLRAIASVAHGGGGIIKKIGRPRIHHIKPSIPYNPNLGTQKQLSKRLEISTLSIQIHQRKNHAPKHYNCFLLWYRARKTITHPLRKHATAKDRQHAAYKRQWAKPDQRTKRLESNKAMRATPDGKAKRNAFVRRWRKQKYDSDPQFRLAVSTRSRIHKVLRRAKIKKCFRTNELISCSAEQLKQWLESQLLPGMTWANYGTHWHVDHKLPLASFDLTDRVQLFAACHYTNLQPLTAFDNMSKGAKLIYVKKAA